MKAILILAFSLIMSAQTYAASDDFFSGISQKDLNTAMATINNDHRVQDDLRIIGGKILSIRNSGHIYSNCASCGDYLVKIQDNSGEIYIGRAQIFNNQLQYFSVGFN